MRKKIELFIKKRHKGSGIGDILGTITCLIAIMVVIFSGLYFYKLMEIKKDITTEVRASLLLLEQNGELTDDDIDMMRQSIIDMGFNPSNIEITYNNNNQKVKYGSEVSISVKATASNEELHISKIFSAFMDNHEFTVSMHSVSKAQT